MSDWASDWRQHFHRKVISSELAVSPPWEYEPGDLIIEPGIAFGTGEHPTTHSCLEAISLWAEEGRACLDVGCGSGILGLAAAHLGMAVQGVDIESDAVKAAQENATKNDLQERTHFSTRPIQRIDTKFDVVVANLFAEVLVELAPDLLRVCGGRLALAGILHDRAHGVRQAFSSATMIREKREGDWVSLWYQC